MGVLKWVLSREIGSGVCILVIGKKSSNMLASNAFEIIQGYLSNQVSEDSAFNVGF